MFIVWWAHLMVTQIVAYVSYRYGSVRMSYLVHGTDQFGDAYGPESSAYQVIRPTLEGWQHWVVEPFRNWDGTWYSWIADRGYSEQYAATSAMFPLYPWLMRWGSDLTGLPVETVGWIISRAAFLVALYVVSLLVSKDFNIDIARWTIVAIAVFPTAFFFGAVYTESLFLMLAVTTLWAARRNDWLLAVILCFFAVLTRSAGIMLGLPLAVLFVQQHGRDIRAWFPKVLLGVIPPLGLVVFGLVLQNNGLDFFDWNNQQWQWNRFRTTPWQTFDCLINGCTATVQGTPQPLPVHPVRFDWIGKAADEGFRLSYLTSSNFRALVGDSQVLDLIVTVLALVLMVIGFWKLPLYYSAWTVMPLVVPLLAPSSVFPLMSMPRFVLPLVPLFVMAVVLIYPRRRLGLALAGISTILLMLLTSQFALWYWVA